MAENRQTRLESALSKGIIVFSLALMLIQRYLETILGNPRISRFIYFSDILQTFSIFLNLLRFLDRKGNSTFHFVSLIVTLNFPFTVTAGILNFFLKLPFEYLTAVILVEVLLRMLLAVNNWKLAKINILSSTGLLAFLTGFLIFSHKRVYSGIKSYLLISLTANLCVSIFAIYFYNAKKENEVLKSALIKQNKTLKELFDGLKIGILRVTRSNSLLINDVAKQFLAEMKINSIFACLPYIKYYDTFKQSMRNSNNPLETLIEAVEHNVFTNLGQIACLNNTFEVSIRICSVNSRVKHFEFTLQNVNYIRKISKEEAENALKSIFLAKMAHEVKNPLMNMRQLVNELSSLYYRSRFDLNLLRESSFKLDLNFIGTYIDKIEEIIDDINVFSSERPLTENTRQDVNLKAIVNSVVNTANNMLKLEGIEALKINLSFDLDCRNIYKANPAAIKQILKNLVKNAVKASVVGQIKLSVSLIEDDEEFHKIEFAVEDEGCGLSKSKIKELLDETTEQPRKRYTEGGSNMGITIVKKLLCALHSSLSLKSKERLGTKASFVLELELVSDLSSSAETSFCECVGDETKKDDSPFDANDFKKPSILQRPCNFINS